MLSSLLCQYSIPTPQTPSRDQVSCTTYPKSGTPPPSPHPALLSTPLTPVTATLTQNPHGLPLNACAQNMRATTPLWHRRIPTALSFSRPFYSFFFSPLGSWLLQNVVLVPRVSAMPDNLSHLQIPVALHTTTPYHTHHLSCHLQWHVSKHPVSPYLILDARPLSQKVQQPHKRIQEGCVFRIKHAGQ